MVVEARAGNVSALRSLLETRDTVLLEGLFKLRGDETPDANPLHDAVRMNHLPVVEVLVDSVCNINATVSICMPQLGVEVASRAPSLSINFAVHLLNSLLSLHWFVRSIEHLLAAPRDVTQVAGTWNQVGFAVPFQ